MTSEKDKVLRNDARSEPERIVHYTPQYKSMGITPKEHHSAAVPKDTALFKGGLENPRLPRPISPQPYAETDLTTSYKGLIPNVGNKGLIPNVGNNMDISWASVDGKVIDDISSEMELVDPDQAMIDNNEYVSVAALGLSKEDPPNIAADEYRSPPDFSIFVECMQSVEDNEYVLFVKGECLSCGSLESIERDAQSLIFGEHELFEGKPVLVEHILIIKKVPVKIGVFLG